MREPTNTCVQPDHICLAEQAQVHISLRAHHTQQTHEDLPMLLSHLLARLLGGGPPGGIAATFIRSCLLHLLIICNTPCTSNSDNIVL